MKLNPNSIIRHASISAIALCFIVGLNNLALADNAAAFKDSIKTDGKLAEAKTTDIKEAGSLAADDGFKKLDANKDGKISLKEAVKDKALAGQFDATDANHDGMVSTDEYASFKSASAVKSTDAATAAPTN